MGEQERLIVNYASNGNSVNKILMYLSEAHNIRINLYAQSKLKRAISTVLVSRACAKSRDYLPLVHKCMTENNLQVKVHKFILILQKVLEFGS